MSREEVLEDTKLSAVKSWFSRSVSFGGQLNGSTMDKGLSKGNHIAPNAAHLDQEAWGKINHNLKHLSMRRVKTPGESEREMVPPGSPSMVPRNVTPLTPLTPLRWKSTPKVDEEEEPEPEEETKLVQEQRSRLGLITVTNAESEEEQDVDCIDTDVVQVTPFDKCVSNAEGVEDGAATESPSGHDLKAASGDNVMTMTIDFLRARLLSERSASKDAKQQIQELALKVMKLELKLEHEVEEKKKAEKSAEEALLKLLTGNFSRVADCTAKSIQHVNSGSGEEIKEELLQRAESCVSDFSRTESIGSSLGSKESRKSSSQLARNDANGHSFVTEGELPKKNNNRAAIETRLWKMWSQMSADMNALAEDGSEGELLMSWMQKVPSVLQNRTGIRKSVALEEMRCNFANGGQEKKAIYQQGKAHESESQDWHEKQEYQEPRGARRRIGYPPSLSRDAEGREASCGAPISRSAEDAFRNAQRDNGGAYPIWDDRDGVGQTPTDRYYRQRDRDEPHKGYEKKYRHGHRRSRSADSSNWPAEEDYGMDMPHQQRLSGEIYPGRTTHSRLDNRNGRLDGITMDSAKTNGSVQSPPNEPVQAPEPKLFLGYGPAFDAPKDHLSSPPYEQVGIRNNSVTDVLFALRKAKASIQKSGSDRAPFMNPHRASWEPVKADSQTQYMSPHCNHMEHDMGAAKIQPSNSLPSPSYYHSAMDLRPATNGHSNYVDQLNVGTGIDFFF